MPKMNREAAIRELQAYLVSEEYRLLAYRAVLSRLSTTSSPRAPLHEKAVMLFEKAFPEFDPVLALKKGMVGHD